MRFWHVLVLVFYVLRRVFETARSEDPLSVPAPGPRFHREGRQGAAPGHGERGSAHSYYSGKQVEKPGYFWLLAFRLSRLNVSLPLYTVSKSILYARYSVQKVSCTLHIAAYPRSVLFYNQRKLG